jgi:hypothetical protein
MARTPLNISRREILDRDKKPRLNPLEKDLIAASTGPSIEIPVSEIRKALATALRERVRPQMKYKGVCSSVY